MMRSIQQMLPHKGPQPPPPLPQEVLRRPRRFLTDPFSGPWTQWWPLDMIQHKGRSEGGGGSFQTKTSVVLVCPDRAVAGLWGTRRPARIKDGFALDSVHRGPLVRLPNNTIGVQAMCKLGLSHY